MPREEVYNLTGEPEACRVYDMEPVALFEYWKAVTNVPCPSECGGTIQWAEAGYVPGYRICDGCGRHFVAKGDSNKPVLVEVPNRRGRQI